MTYNDIVILKQNFDYISRIVMDMISKIPGKKLLFFSTNNSIVFFYNWLRYNYSEYANDIGIYTSINPDKASAKNNTLILTTSKSAGACLDIDDLMVCINMAEPTKSLPQNQQRFGRTRKYNSFYIDLVDISVKPIYNYYKKLDNMLHHSWEYKVGSNSYLLIRDLLAGKFDAPLYSGRKDNATEFLSDYLSDKNV